MDHYRVTYARREDLQRDLETQIERGGLYVLAPPPDELAYGARCSLEVVAPDGRAVSLEGEVLAVTPGHGLAVAMDARTIGELRALVGSLGADAPGAGAPRHERVDGGRGGERAPASAVDVLQSWDSLSSAEKMRLAQHGGRDERAAALRDRNRSLHPHVLKNPRMTVEEVVALARNPQAAPEMLKLIAERSEWMGRAGVAEAIARNPKTPNDVGVRALASCSAEAVRQMAKGVGAPPHIAQAARKRVLG
ncbi:MAG: hypothetical protein EPO40_09935 [Myxococcaceae bacterium]|nr:MAG: hypothetical protein EPO40_09935 [Myxococcaceae bacterium]